jgi:hypothetical protein
MGGLIQPSAPAEERDTSRRTIAVAVVIVMALAVIVAVLLRTEPKGPPGPPPPYAAKLQLSDLKMSAAENFVGSTVTYVDGTVANTGDKAVTHAVVEVVFKDDMGQMAQRETVPLRALKTGGPYPEAVDLSISPLAPGQSHAFRLTFESISAQWNRQYPEIKVIEVTVK